MIKLRMLCVPAILACAALSACGGGGGGTEAVTEQAGDLSAAATDTATELASEATDAVADAAGAIDPAAWQDIEMNWDTQISSVQEAFPDLSVDEITGTAGKPENLVSLIEQKYGISRDEAQMKISEWASSL